MKPSRTSGERGSGRQRLTWVAHRAANHANTIVPALASADAVELDVHLLRGRLEVRHSKALWPLRIYWERGEGILPDERPADLASILAATPDGTHLWFDIKGFTPRLTSRVLRVVDDRFVLTMSSRSWWALRPARRQGDIVTFRSAGSRLQLWFALRVRHPDGVGIPERFADRAVIERLADRVSSIAVWGVRDRRRVDQLRDLGVDVLIVDDLDLVDAHDGDPRPSDHGPD